MILMVADHLLLGKFSGELIGHFGFFNLKLSLGNLLRGIRFMGCCNLCESGLGLCIWFGTESIFDRSLLAVCLFQAADLPRDMLRSSKAIPVNIVLNAEV